MHRKVKLGAESEETEKRTEFQTWSSHLTEPQSLSSLLDWCTNFENYDSVKLHETSHYIWIVFYKSIALNISNASDWHNSSVKTLARHKDVLNRVISASYKGWSHKNTCDSQVKTQLPFSSFRTT